MTVRRDGKQRLYRADRQRLGPLEAFLESFWAGQLDRLATPGRGSFPVSDVVLTRWIAASPQTVFAFFTDYRE